MKALLILLCVLIGVFFLASRLPSKNRETSSTTTTTPAGICSGLKPGQAQKIIAVAQKNGVVVKHREDEVVVDERLWAAIEYDLKVSVGLAEFCDNHPNSSGITFVRGNLSNAHLGSVVDGNWMDGG